MTYDTNPFPLGDAARHAIWEMLVARDIEAFISQDWGLVENDFLADEFFGLHAHGLKNPDSWRMRFPSLDVYRDEWLRQADLSSQTAYAEPLKDALFRTTHLRDIDISGERAVVHKKFDGVIPCSDGTTETLNWQTLYFCKQQSGHWKITSFVGYMPHAMD